MSKTALILGPSGRFGSNMADALWQAGWTLRLFDRSKDDLMQAAGGADVIVNAWNPSYDKWAAELPGITKAVIAAAQSSGARVLFPGNMYVYGKDAPETIGPNTPHLAQNPMGRLRIDAEQAYRDAGVAFTNLRAGDYIDTEMSGNWFDQVMTKPLAKGRLTYPGPLNIPHAWAFLPDVARAAVALLENPQAHQEEIVFPGYTLTGHDLADAIAYATDRDINAKEMAWWPLALARPFMPFIKGMQEMRYLWSLPHGIDTAAFADRLPDFVATPVIDALSKTAPIKALANAGPPKPTHGLKPQPQRSRAQAT